MEISRLFKKLRYSPKSQSIYFLFSHSPQSFACPENPVSPKPSPNFFFRSNRFNIVPTVNSPDTSICLSGSPSVFAASYPLPQSSEGLHCYRYDIQGWRPRILNLGLVKTYNNRWFRCISVSVGLQTTNSMENVRVRKIRIDGIRATATAKQVSDMIVMIMRNENELESKLDSMNICLSIASISEIFRVLNCKRVSALRFFAWIRNSQPELYDNSDICSLAIDNCGWLDDYKTMLSILNDFRMIEGIRLTKKAFRFLPVLVSSKDSIMRSIRRVVEVLNEVGGSCRTSGVDSLIEMLAALGSFGMAKFVMEMTGKEASYYNILVREKCRRGDFEGAREMLDEMSRGGCYPIINAYNYLLSGLCRSDKIADASQVLAEMQERDCHPDALTFEIFICYLCRIGKYDRASEFLSRMASSGIEPRQTTHAAFIKAYFNSMRYKEAYKYVVESTAKYSLSSNSSYSFLAKLHLNKGNVFIARNILLEMIKNGLRPRFSVYARTLRYLRKSGREDLAIDLKSRFSSLCLQSSTESG